MYRRPFLLYGTCHPGSNGINNPDQTFSKVHELSKVKTKGNVAGGGGMRDRAY